MAERTERTERTSRVAGARRAFLTAAATGMALAMAAMPVAGALASEETDPIGGQTGLTITVDKNGTMGETYRAYQIFAGDPSGEAGVFVDVTMGDGADASTLAAWLADNAPGYEGVMGYAAWLTANGHTAGGASVEPQNLAEFIDYYMVADAASNAADPADGALTQPTTTPAYGSFADKLARWAIDNMGPNYTMGGETITDLDSGWYLVISEASSVDDSSGTGAVFVPLTQDTTVKEKADQPTLTKTVKDDNASTYGNVADANKGQALSFKIDVGMPSVDRLMAYPTYSMTVTDQLPDGADVAYTENASGDLVPDVTVWKVVDGGADVDVSDAFTVSYDDGTHVLTVRASGKNEANDILYNAGMSWDSGDRLSAADDDFDLKIVYSAYLNGGAVVGNDGNTNVAKLTYSNNPLLESSADTTEDDATVFTYSLRLVKYDQSTLEPLEGAKFTVQVVSSGTSDSDSVGKYVQEDGSLDDTAYEFETGADGIVLVPRIDEGVYEITETSAPDDYAAQATSAKVTIASTLDDDDQVIGALSLTVSGGEYWSAVDGSDTGSYMDALSSYSIDSGLDTAGTNPMSTVNVKVSNKKKIEMPITGQAGIWALVAASAVAVGYGAVRMRRDREQG